MSRDSGFDDLGRSSVVSEFLGNLDEWARSIQPSRPPGMPKRLLQFALPNSDQTSNKAAERYAPHHPRPRQQWRCPAWPKRLLRCCRFARPRGLQRDIVADEFLVGGRLRGHAMHPHISSSGRRSDNGRRAPAGSRLCHVALKLRVVISVVPIFLPFSVGDRLPARRIVGAGTGRQAFDPLVEPGAEEERDRIALPTNRRQGTVRRRFEPALLQRRSMSPN